MAQGSVRSRSQAGTRRALPVLAIAMTATLTNMLQAAAIFVLLLLAIALLNFLVLGGGRAVPFGSLVQGSRIEFVAGDEGRARPRGDAPAFLDEAQMRRRIDAAAQVIVTSQPKVAGKSMRAFAHECSPVTAAHKVPQLSTTSDRRTGGSSTSWRIARCRGSWPTTSADARWRPFSTASHGTFFWSPCTGKRGPVSARG